VRESPCPGTKLFCFKVVFIALKKSRLNPGRVLTTVTGGGIPEYGWLLGASEKRRE